MSMERVNTIARGMESSALLDDAKPKEIIAACAALMLKYQLEAGYVPQGQIIPFQRPAHRRNLGRMSPLDCA